MGLKVGVWAGALLAAIVAVGPTQAEDGPVFRLRPGAPAPTGEEQVEIRDGLRTLRNVTDPTLTVYAPAPGRANGAAVIVAPGGAFLMLSLDGEGTLVAQRLAERGVTAFVLKYRLEPTPTPDPAFSLAMMQRLLQVRQSPPGPGVPPFKTEPLAVEDAQAAIRLVRAQAGAFHLDPHRIGFLGFSAGAIVATDVSTGPDADARPDFVGVIYGALRNPVPADAPPAFFATAADDPLLADQAIPMVQAWRAAHRPAELHLYERGGHGFGLTPKGTTSDHWLDEFCWWMQSRGLLDGPAR